MSNGVLITSDLSRKLPTKKFEGGSTISIDIPRDSVFKHLSFMISGSVEVTISSGSPVVDSTATMNRLVNYIDVVANGSTTIKNITPWALHMQNLMAKTQFGVRRSTSTASPENIGDVDENGVFNIGATGNFTNVVESVLISFENVLCGKGRMSTLWDTRGLASAELRISTAQLKNVLEDGNNGVLVFDDVNLNFEISTIETQNVPANALFSIWKQTTKTVAFSAQTNDFLVDINRGNYLQGIMFEVRDGSVGLPLSNKALTNIKLILNGTSYLKNETFIELQNKNITQYGLNSPFVSNASLLDGVCYLDLLTPTGGERLGTLNTAQNVQAPRVDQVQCSISTSADASYTKPVSIRITTNEIIKPIAV
jgi:hypothetical protein